MIYCDKKSIYELSTMHTLAKVLFIILLFFVRNECAFADTIGCDADGIVCLNDDLEIYSNEFRTLDLDFDGKSEFYYFDSTGRLKLNSYISNYYLNGKGQKMSDGSVVHSEIEPNSIITYQIDNTNYYYINNVKTKYTENWDVQDQKGEKLKAKIIIDIPEVFGEDRDRIDKVNTQLNNRGLELLKFYAKEEVYKRNTKKLQITINKYIKDEVQVLNFIPNFDNKFYFKFNVYITLEDKSELWEKIGLCVDDSGCYITNWDLQRINNQVYSNGGSFNSSENGYAARYRDYVSSLKDEYIQALIDYIDKYQDYISNYENKGTDVLNMIRAINSYIKNIDSVYNRYIKRAKNAYRNSEIDEETYKYIVDDFRVFLSKYKDILNSNLQVDINALKELNIR